MIGFVESVSVGATLAAKRRQRIDANQELSEKGLRVLAFAARALADDTMSAATADPMAEVHDLTLVSLVGIIDPLRPSAVEAVRVAHGAGIDVRMITGLTTELNWLMRMTVFFSRLYNRTVAPFPRS